MLLIGADPEVFVTKGGKFHSAHGLVPGTKRRPHRVENGAVQVDGLALEVNVTPTADPDTFVFNLASVMSQLRAMIPDEFEFSSAAIARFDADHIIAQPEEALELGCDPDFDAYTMKANPRPKPPFEMRSAGGHIHGGFTKGAMPFEPEHFDFCGRLTRQWDFTVGLPSLILDPDNERKAIYGKAGAFRPKPYGCEYRVPSNYWLKSPSLMKLVHHNTTMGYDLLKAGNFLPNTYGLEAKHCINNNDVDHAKKLCKEIGIPIAA